MSNYQRLISYIYTYEGGIKGKNTGFAKLETRNGQCRLTVNVKKIFVIPQVALTAKISNLPNTAIINMRKNNVHIRTSSYLSYVSYPSVSYLWQLWMGLT